MIWMFTSGALVVWGCILAFQGSMVPEGILTAIGGAREGAGKAVGPEVCADADGHSDGIGLGKEDEIRQQD